MKTVLETVPRHPRAPETDGGHMFLSRANVPSFSKVAEIKLELASYYDHRLAF